MLEKMKVRNQSAAPRWEWGLAEQGGAKEKSLCKAWTYERSNSGDVELRQETGKWSSGGSRGRGTELGRFE